MSSHALKILVVDDDESIRFSFRQVLAKEDHQAIIVENGSLALEQVKKHQFDLAFVDLKMPGVDGMEVLKQIRNLSSKSDVVIITGFGTIATAVEAMKFGAYDYIQKPFSVETIRQVLNKIVEKKNILKGAKAKQLKFDHNGQIETIIGESPRMLEVYDLVHDLSVLPHRCFHRYRACLA